MNERHKARERWIVIGIPVVVISAILIVGGMLSRETGKAQRKSRPQWHNELYAAIDSAKTEQELGELVERYREKWVSIIGYKLDLELIEKVEFKLDDELEKRALKMALASREFLIRYPQSKSRWRMEAIFRDAFQDKEYADKQLEEIRRQQRER